MLLLFVAYVHVNVLQCLLVIIVVQVQVIDLQADVVRFFAHD